MCVHTHMTAQDDDQREIKKDWRKPMDADEAPYDVLQVSLCDVRGPRMHTLSCVYMLACMHASC